MSVLDVLQERGFIKQMSHEAEIKELLEKSQDLINCFNQAYNMENFEKKFMKSYCDNRF